MTVIFNKGTLGIPGTHVLAIGVGNYPHLLGGSKKLANKPLGLKQLQSPPVSLRALLGWFLPPPAELGRLRFANTVAPLASVAALVSPDPGLTIPTPSDSVQLDPATRDNIQLAFDAWLERLKTHQDNIGVFYFCGHGVMASEDYLLAEDFGCRDGQPWAQAFDITRTIRAVEREVPGTVYFLIDACREIARDVAMTLGANPMALAPVDLDRQAIRKSVTAIFATGEGERSFAPSGGKISHFTSALLSALSGYCGVKTPGAATWNVDGESLAKAIRQLLAQGATDGASSTKDDGKQICDQWIQGISVPLLQLSTAPKVKVWLDLSPPHRRASFEMYLQSATGNRVSQTKLDRIFVTEVPRGFYEVGAEDPTGALPPVVHLDEELDPPLYSLTLKSLP